MRIIPNTQPKAFTLIELLIVVAIIAILAAIAVPNFLEAQTRSKISRVKADHRTLATAIEMYRFDNNGYPTGFDQITRPGDLGSHSIFLLSTPIAYVTSGDLQDPFYPVRDDRPMYTTYQYDPMTPDGRMISIYNVDGSYIRADEKPTWWLLISAGPDRDTYFTYNLNSPDDIEFSFRTADADPVPFYSTVYDPTNGTVSRGNIYRAGGSSMNTAGRVVSGLQ
ncbi:MAG: prepilin-type N-terminal cleavage/methylation domain-containing protein [Candidatus Sumerlaeia bacterium]|nr:prepilin-type N-terminal cleavage/methylation domain-containing protein [Candidatus Sumerlaeia bacterium]